MVKARVTKGWIERFVNRCLQEEIALYRIETDGKDTLVWLSLSQYRRACAIAADCHVRLRIVKRYGCPFVWRKIRRRRGLLIGPILFLLLVYLSSLFVWQVKVVGNHTVAEDEILALARRENVCVGALTSSIQEAEAQEAILANCGQLVWCGIHREGSRVTIEVVEKTRRRTQVKKCGDIVARRDGVLTELIVLRGTARKKVGDTVRQGDVLIEGIETYEEEAFDGAAYAGEGQAVAARGIARARVWYEGYGEARLETIQKERTGNEAYGLMIRAGDAIWQWKSEKIKQFALCETDKTVWQWRNQFFPVEIITDIYYECEPITEVLSGEEASALACEQAWRALTVKIPQDAQMKDKRLDFLSEPSSGIVRVRSWIETQEDIGVDANENNQAEE